MTTPDQMHNWPERIENIDRNINLDNTLDLLWDKPWQVIYLRESNDKKYDIFKYEVATWGTKWWIKNKYIQQIGNWIEWTQFTDINWYEIKKDIFNAWEIVYLRVPKNKETKGIPGKIEYIGDKQDDLNRNWKYYSYTFVEWWTLGWVRNKWYSQKWDNENYFEFCDQNWNKLEDERFGKWETIFIKIPNKDIIDPTPEITIDEIMKMSDNDLHQLFDDLVEWANWWGKNNTKDFLYHVDQKWEYFIINGKKIYWHPRSLEDVDNDTPYFTFLELEAPWNVYDLAMWIKNGDDYKWVFCDYDKVYRWKLILNGDDCLEPEH